MTLVEQIAEWAVTHGSGAIAGVTSALVTAWAQRRKAAARTEEAIAATVEQALKRESALEARLIRAEAEASECRMGREEDRQIIGSLEAGCAELRRIIDEMREQLRGWTRSLEQAGIPADDSDERDAALAELTGDAGAHRAEKARIRRIREVSGHRGGGTDV